MQTPAEVVPEMAVLGILAFTTTRAAGSFGMTGAEPVGEVMNRWSTLMRDLSGEASGICIAPQVHGTRVVPHVATWEGLLRTGPADGHATTERGVALAVTGADCAPVFLAHPPTGAVAIVHSGWRGTEAKVVLEAVRLLGRVGVAPDELHVHVGPAICGRCYEVSADVRSRLTGEPCTRSGNVDIRSLIAADVRDAGVAHVSVSPSCTRCDADRFFSHRGGDAGRQISVIVASR